MNLLLSDNDYEVLEKARNSLRLLTKKRARLHWATARVYRVRWYGRFWLEYVGEQAGGGWAVHDLAAFESEFI